MEKKNNEVIDKKMMELRRLTSRASPDTLASFQETLKISWIYHDNALEGTVLTYHELKSAIDENIISDVSLLPSYESIRNHKIAINYIQLLAKKKKLVITLDIIKKIYSLLNTEEGSGGVIRYRKEIPIHRLYFHEIAPPEKISYRIRRLIKFLNNPLVIKQYHPIKLASKAHFRLMSIYPYPKDSGKLARLLMNLILLKNGYHPVIIHATERQRYYEAFRSPHSGLTTLIRESLENSIDSAIKLFTTLERKGSTAWY
jgi:Fic family protein